ncbi:hypothetical protein [Methanobrevibacter sp. DSM 116169]|uniref:hypothetical protein n=1 Tax=Methanobrevibacter sp. DSM 116169 TaxID=3242727 RepID=UPI0038FCC22A
MKFKNQNIIIILVMLFLTILISASSVSAALSENAEGNFTNLDKAIQDVDIGGTVYLTDDVELEFSEATAYRDGIKVTTDDITIDGQNNVINANNLVSIFNIEANNVVIKNIKLVNAGSIYATNTGSAIINSGNNTQLVGGVTIANSTGTTYGGAIYNTGDYFTISGTNYFINNSLSVIQDTAGGAIYNTGDYFTIEGSNVFDSNYIVDFDETIRSMKGGAIANYGDNFLIEGTNAFKNNRVTGMGGAIFAAGTNITINGNNLFTNNTALQPHGLNVLVISGAVLALGSTNNVLINGTNIFEKNGVNTTDGGVIYMENTNNTVISGANKFIENTAKSGGVFYSHVLGNNKNLTITGANIFEYNNPIHGGIFYFQCHNVVINGTNYFRYNNVSTNWGVGVIWGNDFLLNGTNVIANNTAMGSVSGIQISGDRGTIYGTNVIANNTAYDGYGVFNFLGNDFTVNGTNIFRNNNATDGGAIALGNSGKNFTVEGTNLFENNYASSNGGAIQYGGIDAIITGTNLFINNGAGAGGVIGNINGHNLTIFGENQFLNNYASNGGVIGSSGRFDIIGTNIFKNNTATNNGGVINAGSGNVGIYGTNIFANNTAGAAAGVGYMNNDNFVIDGTNLFENNTASNDGGVFDIRSVYANINGTNVFRNNTAGRYGGVIHFNGRTYDDTEYVIEGDNEFLMNDARSGGVIYINNYAKNILIKDNNIFTDNIATDNGGVIYNSNSKNLTIIGNTFEYNVANNGGVIYHTNSYSNLYPYNFGMILKDTHIKNNRATNGGSVYTTGNEKVVIENVTFSNTSAIASGGAIFSSTNELYIYNCIFYDSNATDGGAIYITGNYDARKFEIVNVTISDSKASGNGGGIFNGRSNAMVAVGLLKNVTVVDNIANNGGGIYNGGVLIISGMNNISNNAANSTDGLGGGIYNTRHLNFTDYNLIADNSAFNGGGIYNTGSWSLNINGKNDIIRNTAYNNGGGIYSGSSGFTLNGTNNISNNVAVNGGGIYNGGNNAIITGSNNISNNVAVNGGGIYNAANNLIISGNYLLNNIAVNGTALYNTGSLQSLNVRYSSADSKHLIYNTGTMFLNNNNMVSNNVEKIFNLGMITSKVFVIYMNNKTIPADLSDVININVTVTDDVGNTIVGQNVTVDVKGINEGNISTFTNGFYYMNYVVTQTGVSVVNGVYNGGNNLTVRNGIILVNDASLTITKSVNVTEANVDDFIGYTITIVNNELVPITDVVVREFFPDGLGFVGMVPVSGSWVPVGVDSWSLVGSIAPGASVSFTLVFQVLGNVTGLVNNTVNVKTNQTGGNESEGNNTTSPNTNLTNVTLDFSKSVNVSSANVDDFIGYTVVVKNTGSTVATDVVVREFFPDGLGFVGMVPVSGSWVPVGVDSWSLVGSIAPGASVSFTLVFQVLGNVTGLVNNTVNVKTNQTGGNESEGNNTTSPNTNLTNVTLDFSKSVNVSSANVDDFIGYTVVVKNTGSTVATDVVVREFFPDGLGFVGMVPVSGSWVPVGVDSWSLVGSIAPGASVSFTLVFQVLGNVTGLVNNTVNVKTNQTGGNESEGNNTTSPNTNLTNVTLDFSKSVNVSSANVDDFIGYTVVVKNTGSTVATDVVVREFFPDGLGFVGMVPVSGSWVPVGVDSWSLVGSIAPGASVSFTLVFQVLGNVTGLVNNTVNVKTNQTGGNESEGNNTTSPNTNLTNVTLDFSKSVNVSSANVDDFIGYTVVVKNTGSTVATDVVVREFFPDGLGFVGMVPVSGSWVPVGVDSWSLVGSIAPGASVSFTLVFQVLGNVTGLVNNTVNVKTNQTGGNESEGNNTTSPNTNLTNVTLDFSKSVNVSSANVDDFIGYTVVVKNTGSTVATDVVVREFFPDGLGFVGMVPVSGSWVPVGVDSWSLVGSIAPGASVSFTLVFQVLGNVTGLVNNTVNVKTNQTGGNESEGNNTTSPNTNLTNVTLDFSKSVNVSSANVDDFIGYTVVVKNTGSTVATDVVVREFFPDGLGFVGMVPVSGSWVPVGVDSWSLVGSIAPGASVSFTLVFQVLGNVTGLVNNTVNVKTNQTGGNESEGNNTTSPNTNLTNVTLDFSKSVNVSSANVDDFIGYTVVVKNTGSTVATDVVVREFFPDGLGFVGMVPVSGSWVPVGVDSWSLVGSIAPGASVSFTLVFQVLGNVTGLVNNTVNVKTNQTGGNESEGNNTTSPNTNLTNVTLHVLKTANTTVADIGDMISYTITIKNVGSTAATGVVATDYYSYGLTYVGYVGDNWSNISNVWYYSGSIAAGETVNLTLIFILNVNASDVVNNTVNVTSNQTPEGNTSTSNNTTVMIPTILTIEIADIKYGEDAVISVILTDMFGNPISGDVIVNINGTDYTVNVVNGIGNFTVPGLIAGYYEFNGYYNGTSLYSPSYDNGTFIVSKVDVIIEVTNVTAKPGDTVTINGTVIDELGNIVTNGTLKITLPDGTETTVFITDGTFEITWIVPDEFESGEYPIILEYIGDNNYNDGNGKGIATIEKLNVTIVVDPITGKPGDTVIVNGTVIDELGNPVNKGNVTITLPDGTVVTVPVINGTYTTNWTIPDDFKPGNYTVIVQYNNNTYYNNGFGNNSAFVDKLNTVTTVNDVKGKPGDTVIITGEVIDERGYPVKNGTVILTLPDGSKIPVPVIDGKFEYKWTIPKHFKAGTYVILAEFVGDDYYYSSSANATLTVYYVLALVPSPDAVDDMSNNLDSGNMKNTGNPIAMLVLALFSGVFVLYRRK